jgi:hypothetical protein
MASDFTAPNAEAQKLIDAVPAPQQAEFAAVVVKNCKITTGPWTGIPAKEGLLCAPRSGHSGRRGFTTGFVKGFGFRPFCERCRALGPASGSLQGTNPRGGDRGFESMEI